MDKLLTSFLVGVVAIIVIFAVLPLLWNKSAEAQSDSNAPAGDKSLVALVPFIMIAGLLVAVVYGFIKGRK